MAVNISIHASRVGGDKASQAVINTIFTISIHASRVGGDIYCTVDAPITGISIHASRVGGDDCARNPR